MEVPRETNTLEGFEAWDPDAGSPAKEGYGPRAFVSVRPGGNFGFNWNARKLLGDPTHVEFLFDPVRRRVGFRGVPADHPRGRALGGLRHGGYANVAAVSFCKHYDITVDQSRRYTPRVIEDVLVIDL